MLQENFDAIDQINCSAIQSFLNRPVDATDKGKIHFNYINTGEDRIQVYHLLYDNVLLGCVCYGHVSQKIHVVHSCLESVANVDKSRLAGQVFRVSFYCINTLN